MELAKVSRGGLIACTFCFCFGARVHEEANVNSINTNDGVYVFFFFFSHARFGNVMHDTNQLVS